MFRKGLIFLFIENQYQFWKKLKMKQNFLENHFNNDRYRFMVHSCIEVSRQCVCVNLLRVRGVRMSWYQVVPKVRATHPVLYAWNISFKPSCRACIFSMIHFFFGLITTFSLREKIFFFTTMSAHLSDIILRTHSSMRNLFQKSRYTVL